MDKINMKISKSDIVDIISESQRFMFHIFIVNMMTHLIDNKPEEILGETIIKTLLATAIAVIIYNIFIKKLIEPKLKKLKKMNENK